MVPKNFQNTKKIWNHCIMNDSGYRIDLLNQKLDDETWKHWECRVFWNSNARTFKEFLDTLENYCKYLQQFNQETSRDVKNYQRNKNVKKRVTTHVSTTFNVYSVVQFMLVTNLKINLF